MSLGPPIRSLALARVLAGLLSCAAVSLIHGQNSTEMSREELYERVFGIRMPDLPDKLEVFTAIDGENGIRTTISFSKNRTSFRLPVDDAVQLLAANIDSTTILKIRHLSSEGLISDSALAIAGIRTSFDRTRFLLKLETSPSIRKPQSVFISGSPPLHRSDVKPALISGYMNFFASQGYHSFSRARSITDTSTFVQNLLDSYLEDLNARRVQPLSISSDVALRVLPVVFEGRYTFRSTRDYSLMREDVRAVLHSERLAMSFRLGDDVYRISGFQKFVKSGGLGISREFSAQPHRLSYPVSEYTIVLKEPAQVQIFVNEMHVKTLTLSAGTHHLKEFGLGYGENQVELLIRTFDGKEEKVNLSFYSDRQILAKGISDFSVFAGFPSTRDAWTYDYDLSIPVVSGYFSYGLSDRINVSGNGQFHKSNTVLGAIGQYASEYGLLTGEAALSSFAAETIGGAARITNKLYLKEKGERSGNNHYAMGEVQFFSKKFSYITDTIAHKDTYLSISGSYRKPFSPELTAGIGLSVSLTRQDSHLYSVSATLSARPARGLSLNGRFKYERDSRGLEYPSVAFNGVWAVSAKRHSITAGEALQKTANSAGEWNNYTNVTWNYRSSYSLSDHLFSSAGVILDPFSTNLNATVGYTTNYGVAEVHYTNSSSSAETHPINQHIASLDMKTALVFADGHLGISRPVTNSFVMVAGKGDMRRSTININPGFEGYDAVKRGLLPGVFPELPQYSPRRIALEPQEMRALEGAKLLEHHVFSGYKTAHLITLGGRRTVLVYGTLLLPGGSPAGNRLLTIRNTTDKESEATTTFTSSTGRFSFAGVPKAVYSIALDGETSTTLEVKNVKEDHYQVTIQLQ